MAMPNKKGWLAILFILACLAIPFGITYYVSTDTFKGKYSQWRGPMPQTPEGATLENSRTIDGRVTLVKGERIRIANTSLVFNGVDNGEVTLDLFLEELDPSHAYAQSFPKDIGGEELVRFGDVAYRVIGVSRNALILEIYKKMGAQ